jgi:hypothetical protein
VFIKAFSYFEPLWVHFASKFQKGAKWAFLNKIMKGLKKRRILW